MDKKRMIISRDCQSCNDMKKEGLCKDNKCLSVETHKGIAIAAFANVIRVPQEVCWSERKGQYIKCGNSRKLEKRYRKKKK